MKKLSSISLKTLRVLSLSTGCLSSLLHMVYIHLQMMVPEINITNANTTTTTISNSNNNINNNDDDSIAPIRVHETLKKAISQERIKVK